MATHANVEATLKADLKLIHSNGQVGPSLLQAPTIRGARRRMTLEQGHALEVIGHAVDYLSDSYIHEGPDNQILDFRGPEMDAVRLLIAAQRQILQSLPISEPFSLRLWHSLLRRKPQFKSGTVVPLSSSR